MKKFIMWKCDMCEAVFEFDVEVPPLRCPDCFSPKDHLHCVDENVSKNSDANDAHQKQS
ncbi:MAG: hypothetical protein ACD_81C00217G0014 [uncultured bacterium]|nr:MAG: hypothetical protein ACD_81C00217G0014 [uncultured bacterium]